jgi:Fur family zinc uptake transcriptional regulator
MTPSGEPKGTLSTDPVSGVHDHARCLREALDTADAVCARRGARLTPLRRRVLELIWASHNAVKAYELLDRLADDARPARPPTVYRALEFLMAHGLVHRVDSLNAFVGCPQAAHRHDAQLFICHSCGRVQEIAEPIIANAVSRGARRLGFEVQRQTIEMHGRCGACR